jgi:SWI/SNF-related matrix-associated actin-dependent regulator 1 of chromatin subfamily A
VQAASLVVFAEYSWTPGDMVQAEDRAHRIGQRQSVNVHYLHVKKSIDDVMWNTLATKLDQVGQVSPAAFPATQPRMPSPFPGASCLLE